MLPPCFCADAHGGREASTPLAARSARALLGCLYRRLETCAPYQGLTRRTSRKRPRNQNNLFLPEYFTCGPKVSGFSYIYGKTITISYLHHVIFYFYRSMPFCCSAISKLTIFIPSPSIKGTVVEYGHSMTISARHRFDIREDFYRFMPVCCRAIAKLTIAIFPERP